jgi:hypothetical protein
MGIRELRFSEPDGPALHYDPPNEESFGDQPLVGNEIMFYVLDQGMLTEREGFFKFGPFPTSFSHSFSINFLAQFKIILLLFVHLSCLHIHTFHDFLDYGTLLSPELELLTLSESTEELKGEVMYS